MSGAGNRFADDATHIYWLDGARIVRAPKTGGDSGELALGESFAFGAFAVDDASIYITNAFASALYKVDRKHKRAAAEAT